MSSGSFSFGPAPAQHYSVYFTTSLYHSGRCSFSLNDPSITTKTHHFLSTLMNNGVSGPQNFPLLRPSQGFTGQGGLIIPLRSAFTSQAQLFVHFHAGLSLCDLKCSTKFDLMPTVAFPGWDCRLLKFLCFLLVKARTFLNNEFHSVLLTELSA